MKKIIIIIIILLSTIGIGSKIVQKVVFTEVSITNLVITTSSYTNKELEEKFQEEKYFIQLNFDFTNKTTNDIILDGSEFVLHYDTKHGTVSQTVSFYAPGDTQIQNEKLNPGETISIQSTNAVTIDAENFYVVMHSTSSNVTTKSDIVKKVRTN